MSDALILHRSKGEIVTALYTKDCSDPLTLLPDNKTQLVAIAYDNGTLISFTLEDRLLSQRTMKSKGSQYAHSGAVTGLCLLEKSNNLVSVGADGTMCCWDWQGNGALQTFTFIKLHAFTCCFAKNETVYAGTDNGCVWKWENDELSQLVKLQNQCIQCCTGSKGYLFIAQGGDCITVDCNTGCVLSTQNFERRENIVSLQMRNNDLWCTSGKSAKKWTFEKGQMSSSFKEDFKHFGAVTAVAVLPKSKEGTILLTGSNDKIVRVWHESGQCKRLCFLPTPVSHVVFAGKKGFISASKETVRLHLPDPLIEKRAIAIKKAAFTALSAAEYAKKHAIFANLSLQELSLPSTQYGVVERVKNSRFCTFVPVFSNQKYLERKEENNFSFPNATRGNALFLAPAKVKMKSVKQLNKILLENEKKEDLKKIKALKSKELKRKVAQMKRTGGGFQKLPKINK
eukprot:g4313.t1